MEAVKLKKRFINIISCMLLYSGAVMFQNIFESNEILPTYNSGGYTFNFNPGNTNGITIQGEVLELGSQKPIHMSMVSVECSQLSTDIKGNFKFDFPFVENDSVYVQIRALGYKTIDTKYFKFKEGESLNLKIYLEIDNRPINDCGI
ncbi:hypothetical protein ACV07N_16095 [Roseivirga echinicomitans]